MDSRILSTEHAHASGVAEQWDESNEAWWDWYLSLADEGDALGELMELDPPAAVELPSIDELREELATPYALSDDQLSRFRADGYIKLRDVLTPGALGLARAEVDRLAAAGVFGDVEV